MRLYAREIRGAERRVESAAGREGSNPVTADLHFLTITASRVVRVVVRIQIALISVLISRMNLVMCRSHQLKPADVQSTIAFCTDYYCVHSVVMLGMFASAGRFIRKSDTRPSKNSIALCCKADTIATRQREQVLRAPGVGCVRIELNGRRYRSGQYQALQNAAGDRN